jgi:hypothetical protein
MVAVGLVTGAAAAVLVVPFPELGVPLLLAALRLLALEFEWAARAYEPVLRTWERAKALPLGAKLAVGAAGLAVVGALVLWLG